MRRYIPLGLVAGALQTALATIAFGLVAALDRHYGWPNETPPTDWWNEYPTVFIVSYFVLTTLEFISGGMLGDVAKLRAKHQDGALNQGLPRRLAALIYSKTKIVSEQRLRSIIWWVRAASPALVAAVIALAAALINALTAVGKGIFWYLTHEVPFIKDIPFIN